MELVGALGDQHAVGGIGGSERDAVDFAEGDRRRPMPRVTSPDRLAQIGMAAVCPTRNCPLVPAPVDRARKMSDKTAVELSPRADRGAAVDDRPIVPLKQETCPLITDPPSRTKLAPPVGMVTGVPLMLVQVLRGRGAEVLQADDGRAGGRGAEAKLIASTAVERAELMHRPLPPLLVTPIDVISESAALPPSPAPLSSPSREYARSDVARLLDALRQRGEGEEQEG